LTQICTDTCGALSGLLVRFFGFVGFVGFVAFVGWAAIATSYDLSRLLGISLRGRK
jgi:hypothetical protein